MRSNPNQLISNKLTAQTIQISTDQQAFPMFLSLQKPSRIGNSPVDKCLRAFSLCFPINDIPDKLNLLVFLVDVGHFELLLVGGVFCEEVQQLALLLVLLVLDH